MKVSVVIATYNRAKLLYRTLYTFWKQQATDYEILVANDDDFDREVETLAVCQEFIDKGVPITVFNTNKYKRGMVHDSNGWSVGEGWSNESYPFNVGIRHATGDIVMLNGGEVMNVTNTIEQHRKHHLQANGKTCLVSTVHALANNMWMDTDNYDWKTDANNLLFDGSCKNLYVGDGKSYLPGCPYRQNLRPFHFQMSVPRKALFDIGGFDEDFYGEMPYGDNDISLRLVKWGIEFVYSKEAITIHQAHGEPLDMTTKFTRCVSNPKYSGEGLYDERRNGSIVRNAKHEWGQYPRDMVNLPEQSGAVNN